MIYLTRTMIALDGTRTTETAVLEDGTRLSGYLAQGWKEVSWPAFRETWRAKSTDMIECLIQCAGSLSRWCPRCTNRLAHQENGGWWCANCRKEWTGEIGHA